MTEPNSEAVPQVEHHEEVVAFDDKIAEAASDDMSDEDKQKLNALIEERNATFLKHHTVESGEPNDGE